MDFTQVISSLNLIILDMKEDALYHQTLILNIVMPLV
jgi:hypothetical protein